jgi:hypothetical protein
VEDLKNANETLQEKYDEETKRLKDAGEEMKSKSRSANIQKKNRRSRHQSETYN